jgi:hypothetical protein
MLEQGLISGSYQPREEWELSPGRHHADDKSDRTGV